MHGCAPGFDGTLKSLARIYETHPESPYPSTCFATRRVYAFELAVLIKAVGDRRVDKITGADLRRWHAAFAKPKQPNGEPRLRRAQGCMPQWAALPVAGGAWPAAVSHARVCARRWRP
jgi:hypothetical protein